MYIYLFPFGFQYTFTTLPQLGHFSDTMIHPEPVSPISQARFLHRLSGHFIFRIIPPPLPQNTSIAISPHRYVEREPDRHMVLSLLGSLLSFVLYWFSSYFLISLSTKITSRLCHSLHILRKRLLFTVMYSQ